MKDLSASKLDLISYLVNLKDEVVLNELISVMTKYKNGISSINNKLTEEDLVDRALKSNENYQKGNYISQESLELDSEKW